MAWDKTKEMTTAVKNAISAAAAKGKFSINLSNPDREAGQKHSIEWPTKSDEGELIALQIRRSDNYRNLETNHRAGEAGQQS